MCKVYDHSVQYGSCFAAAKQEHQVKTKLMLPEVNVLQETHAKETAGPSSSAG